MQQAVTGFNHRSPDLPLKVKRLAALTGEPGFKRGEGRRCSSGSLTAVLPGSFCGGRHGEAAQRLFTNSLVTTKAGRRDSEQREGVHEELFFVFFVPS
jgi:hypothetical protein